MSDNDRASRQNAWNEAGPVMISSRPNRAYEPSEPAQMFDFKAALSVLGRRLGLIFIVTAICVGITVFLNSLTPPTYTASNRILLDEQSLNPFGKDEVFADLQLTNPVVESQMQLIQSPYLLSTVVDQLNLSENDMFLNPPPTPVSAWLSQLRNSFLPPSGGTITIESEAERFQNAVEILRESLNVTRNAQTLVIRLQFSAASPELAAEVVNAIAETYINDRSGSRMQTAERASDWFDERISALNVQAMETEMQIERLSRGGTEALGASQGAANLQAAREQLQAMMAERSRAQTDLLRYRTLIESNRGLRGVPSNIGSDALSALVSEAATARADLAAALLDESTEPTIIQRLTDRIESLEAAGTSLLNSLLEQAEIRAAEAEKAVEEAELAFEGTRQIGGANISNAIEVELRSLEGEARIYRQLHDRYLESYLNTIQQQSFPSTEATIIEVAVPPQFSDGPGSSSLALLAVLVGLSLGSASAFVLNAVDDSVRTIGQLAKTASAPVLGLLPSHADRHVSSMQPGEGNRIPLISAPIRSQNYLQEVIALPEHRISMSKTAPQIYAAISDPLSTYAESIRRVNVEAENLRSILSIAGQVSTKTIGFISDQSSEGRSIAAVNYAEMLAVGGSRTLLIDLDWTGMYLTEKITPAAQAGLAEFAMARSSDALESAFWYDERSGLYFLPNRSMDPHAVLDPGVFDQARLKTLIRLLSQKFDSVVVDLSPMAKSSDPAALSDVLLGFVAVADWGKTKAASLSRELRRSAIQPPKLLGTLLNGISQQKLDKYESAA